MEDADNILFHTESQPHLQVAVEQARKKGIKVGLSGYHSFPLPKKDFLHSTDRDCTLSV